MNRIKVLAVSFFIGCFFTGISQAEDQAKAIQKGSAVAFKYVLTVDGQVVDSSREGAPLRYVHGEGKIIPGLEAQLEGMRAGETKTISVPPEQAYGQAMPEKLQEVDRSLIPQDAQIEPGAPLQIKSPDGRSRVVKIAQVKEDKVVIDFNHPLAGKTLNFDVEIVSVE